MPNNDYILRSDSIDAMTLNALQRNLDSVYDGEGKRYCRAAQRVIASLPAADVEPVVRCENCQFFEIVEYWPDGTKKVCQRLKRQVQENSFCCWGMKKETQMADDCIKRSDALKAILGVSIYDTIEELEGARTIAENTWADGLYDAYKIIEDEVDAVDVEPKQRWIPVTERLPEERHIVMTYQPIPSWMKSGMGWIRAAEYIGNGKWREAEQHNMMKLPVTHWMPLPEPPKEEVNDNKNL